MNSQELIDAEMIIDMEYTDWNQNVDITKIISDMQANNIDQITQIAFKAILEKMGFDEERSS